MDRYRSFSGWGNAQENAEMGLTPRSSYLAKAKLRRFMTSDLIIINVASRKKGKEEAPGKVSITLMEHPYDMLSILLIIPHLSHLIITNSNKVGTTDKTLNTG